MNQKSRQEVNYNMVGQDLHKRKAPGIAQGLIVTGNKKETHGELPIKPGHVVGPCV
jgi:hypothetical protein